MSGDGMNPDEAMNLTDEELRVVSIPLTKYMKALDKRLARLNKHEKNTTEKVINTLHRIEVMKTIMAKLEAKPVVDEEWLRERVFKLTPCQLEMMQTLLDYCIERGEQ